MRRIFLLLTTGIMMTSGIYAQKVYITREALTRLTRRLSQCEVIEQRLTYTTREITALKRVITNRELDFLFEKARLDSIIANGEADMYELKDKYERALRLVPRRKRRLIRDGDVIVLSKEGDYMRVAIDK
jgi:hypothetical protein